MSGGSLARFWSASAIDAAVPRATFCTAQFHLFSASALAVPVLVHPLAVAASWSGVCLARQSLAACAQSSFSFFLMHHGAPEAVPLTQSGVIVSVPLQFALRV